LNSEKWIPLYKLTDDMKIWAGTIVRLNNVMFTPDDRVRCYDYIVSFIYDNDEHLQLTCITQGEAGNILCVLKKDMPNHYALGTELKRMLSGEDVAIKMES